MDRDIARQVGTRCSHAEALSDLGEGGHVGGIVWIGETDHALAQQERSRDRQKWASVK